MYSYVHHETSASIATRINSIETRTRTNIYIYIRKAVTIAKIVMFPWYYWTVFVSLVLLDSLLKFTVLYVDVENRNFCHSWVSNTSFVSLKESSNARMEHDDCSDGDAHAANEETCRVFKQSLRVHDDNERQWC
jgi:hypothetical protein